MVSCRPDGEKDLAALKEQRNNLETQLAELNSQIKVLEKKTGKNVQVVQKTIFVQTLELKPITFQHFIEVQGSVTTDQNLTVSPKTSGEILQIHVIKGQSVTKGTVLANIEVTSQMKAKEEVLNGLAFATDVYEKQKSLWDQKVGSEIQFLQAKNNKENLEKKLASLNVQIAMGTVKAPANGVIDEIFPKEGENIAPGHPMFRLVGKGDFKIAADVSESYATMIKEGNYAEVLFPDLKQTFKTYVKVAGNEINQLNRTFNVELAMPSVNSNTKANMITYIKIKDYEKKESLSVPISVVQKSQEGDFVYVDSKGKAAKKLVTVGRTSSGQAEILNGLLSGDKVITIGYLDLIEGQPLKY